MRIEVLQAAANEVAEDCAGADVYLHVGEDELGPILHKFIGLIIDEDGDLILAADLSHPMQYATDNEFEDCE